MPRYEVHGYGIRVHFAALKEALLDSDAPKRQSGVINENDRVNEGLTEDVGINVGINVGITERKLMELIAADPDISANDAADKLGITQRQVERLFSQLKEKKLIERVGARKNGHWEILPPKKSEK